MSCPAPTVSVVIPCYNGALFLRETLHSVLAQRLPPLEVIVVDDGSTDDSAAIAESFGAPVRVIRQPNQGESVAHNRGITESKGAWIAFLDADDVWLPEKLAEQATRIQPNVGALCSGTVVRYTDGREVLAVPRSERFQRSTIIEHGAPCHISTLLVRRDVTARFPTWTSYAEDLLYYLDLLQHTQIAIVENPLVVYRIHAAAQTAKPGIRERQDASLARWLADRSPQLPPDEQREFAKALRRRAKFSLLSRALACRKSKLPLTAAALYARVLLHSLYTPTSGQIVKTGLASFVGALAETVRLRKHPA